jgi:hypothetical protein
VLVVVVAVSCVSAAVVDVVDVVAMRNRHVATAIAVNMVVLRMHLMPAGGLAFVVVIVVPSMKVTVVQIVDVITVRDCNMSAAFAVDVRMIDVFVVNCLGHRFLTAVSTRLCLLSVLAHASLRYDRPLAGSNAWRPPVSWMRSSRNGIGDDRPPRRDASCARSTDDRSARRAARPEC